MIHTNHPCSPETLETTTNPAHKGADIHYTSITISIPTAVYHRLYQENRGHETVILPKEKSRMTPVIHQARQELCSRGLTVIPVRGGSPVLIDLIAWDETAIYGIAVRRIRGTAGIADIMARHSPLIRQLQTIRIPRIVDVRLVEIQLWIYTTGSFQVYQVLAGGIMKRSLP